MNPNELLRIVDSLHRDKNIDPEVVFQAIEAALVTAAKRQYGEESNIVVRIARENGAIDASCLAVCGNGRIGGAKTFADGRTAVEKCAASGCALGVDGARDNIARREIRQRMGAFHQGGAIAPSQDAAFAA